MSKAIIFAPFTDDEVPNEEDQSISNVITEPLAASVETPLFGPNTEASTPASLITVENRSTGCVDTDAHGTESFSSKSTGLSLRNHVYPENTSSEGGRIEANDLRLLPEAEDTSPSGICGTIFFSNRCSIFSLSTSYHLTIFLYRFPTFPPTFRQL